MRFAALCLVALAVGGSTSAAGEPPEPYLTYAAPSGGFCLKGLDGSPARRLTNGRDYQPAWSPNGRYLAFVRSVSGGQAVSQIYFTDASGRRARDLARSRDTFNTGPTWSRNSKRVAFEHGSHEGYIGLVNADGSRRLTVLVRGSRAPFSVFDPIWRPNGRIAFTRYPPGGYQPGVSDPPSVYTIRLDGYGLRRIAAEAAEPDWSPDERQVVFTRATAAGQFDIALADADGSNARALVSTPAVERIPRWSPDGRFIAFTRSSTLRSFDFETVVLRSDTGSEVFRAPGGGPVWSPDGRYVAHGSPPRELVVRRTGTWDEVLRTPAGPGGFAWRRGGPLPPARAGLCRETGA